MATRYDVVGGSCSDGEQRGTEILDEELARRFGGSSYGIYNCFAAETLVVTRDGIVPIGDLVGTEPELLTARSSGVGAAWWVRAPIHSFGLQRITELTITRHNAQRVIRTTAEHRWLTRTGKKPIAERTTAELRAGDQLHVTRPQSVASRCNISGVGAAHGIIFGDGTRSTHDCRIALFGAKSELLRFFPEPQVRGYTDDLHGSYLLVTNLPRSFKSLPAEDEGPSYLYSWLAGYFATDGDITKKGTLRLSCADPEILAWVGRMALSHLGIVTHGPFGQKRVGINGVPSMIYTLHLDRATLDSAFFLRTHHRERFDGLSERMTPVRWTVVSVEHTDVEEEVYCAVVPDAEAFVLDGMILTGNCRNTRHGGQYGAGRSFHAEGRALDRHFVNEMQELAAITWCLFNSEAWGIQEVIDYVRNRRWTSDRGWRYFDGSPDEDWVHITQNWDGALQRTAAYRAGWTPPTTEEQEDDMGRFIADPTRNPREDGRRAGFYLDVRRKRVVCHNGGRIDGDVLVDGGKLRVWKIASTYPLLDMDVVVEDKNRKPIAPELCVLAADSGTFGAKIQPPASD